jgi:hypothetical protein
MIAEEKARERSENAKFQKKLRDRTKTTADFKKFLEEPSFNLKVYQLRERSAPPTPEEVKNILGNISDIEVESLCYEILPRYFKHWGKTNDYSYQMKVLGKFRGSVEEPPFIPSEPGKVVGSYAHPE